MKCQRILLTLVTTGALSFGGWAKAGPWDQTRLAHGQGDCFGESVAIYDDYALIGARHENGWTGAAYVFKRQGTNWVQQARLNADDGEGDDRFGNKVSIHGNWAIIGAFADDRPVDEFDPFPINGHDSGSAYVFHRGPGGWTQQAKLTADDGQADDLFGIGVSIYADQQGHPYAIVGAGYDDDNGHDSGSVYAFSFDGAAWAQQKLKPADGTVGGYFGNSVSASGDYAVVGATGTGAAYVLKRQGTEWTQTWKLTHGGGGVSIHGDRIVVTAGDDSGRVFQRKEGTEQWEQMGGPIGGAPGTKFSNPSINGDYVIAGGWRDDDTGEGAGAAYVFHWNGANWTQISKLTAPDAAPGDEYGISTAIGQSHGIVGTEHGDAAYLVELPGLLEPIPGDANRDGVVDDLDLTALVTHWQQYGGLAEGDFNGDGFISESDLTILANAWPSGGGVGTSDTCHCADFNNDDVIDDVDLTILATHWLEEVCGMKPGDANGDLAVDDLDLAILASCWPNGPGPDISGSRSGCIARGSWESVLC